MKEILKQVGLSEKESEVYLELIRSGPINANLVAKQIGIGRTVTYNILNNLIEKGLVSYVIKEKIKLFNAADPENLLKPIKEKEELLSEIIPKIRSLQKVKPEESIVEVYEGKEGLKTIIQIALKRKAEVDILGGTGKAYLHLPFQASHREKEMIQKQLKIRAIFNYQARTNRFTKLPNVKSRYLPKGYENNATTSIFSDFIAIHILTGKPFIILIKNKEMAKGYRNYFKLLWDIAK